MLTSQEIRSTTFEVVKRGYSTEDVDAFLKKIADEIEAFQKECALMLKEKDDSVKAMEQEKKATDGKILVLAEKLEDYRSQETILRNALITAEKMKESLLTEAQQTSDIMIKDAQQKADKIVETANKKVLTQQEVLLKMQQEVAKFKNQMLDIYKTHLSVISALPEDIDEDLEEAVKAGEEEQQKKKAEEAAAPAEEPKPEEPAAEETPAEQPAEAAPAEAIAEEPAATAADDTVSYDGYAPRKAEEPEKKSFFGQFSFGDKSSK